MFLVEERHEIREIVKIIPTELDDYLSQFVLAQGPRLKKIMNRHLSVELRLVFNAIYIKTIFKDSDFTKTRNALKAKQK